MSQQEEDPSHYTRTLVVKPALSQMYDQLLPTSKSLETACKTTALIRRRPVTCVYLDLGISQTVNVGWLSIRERWLVPSSSNKTELIQSLDKGASGGCFVSGYVRLLKSKVFSQSRVWNSPKAVLKGSVERSRHERHFCSLLPYFLLSWLQIFQLCLSFCTSSPDLVLFKKFFQEKEKYPKNHPKRLSS